MSCAYKNLFQLWQSCDDRKIIETGESRNSMLSFLIRILISFFSKVETEATTTALSEGELESKMISLIESYQDDSYSCCI